MRSSLKMKAGRWFKGARGKLPKRWKRTKKLSAQRKMKSLPRSPIFVCVLHPNGQGKRYQFSKSRCRSPQVFACFAPGRDSTSVAGSRSFATSGVSSVSSGLGSSSVDPSLLEQHQSPDGSFLVSRGTPLRRCLSFFGARSSGGSSRSLLQSWLGRCHC